MSSPEDLQIFPRSLTKFSIIFLLSKVFEKIIELGRGTEPVYMGLYFWMRACRHNTRQAIAPITQNPFPKF